MTVHTCFRFPVYKRVLRLLPIPIHANSTAVQASKYTIAKYHAGLRWLEEVEVAVRT